MVVTLALFSGPEVISFQTEAWIFVLSRTSIAARVISSLAAVVALTLKSLPPETGWSAYAAVPEVVHLVYACVAPSCANGVLLLLLVGSPNALISPRPMPTTIVLPSGCTAIGSVVIEVLSFAW